MIAPSFDVSDTQCQTMTSICIPLQPLIAVNVTHCEKGHLFATHTKKIEQIVELLLVILLVNNCRRGPINTCKMAVTLSLILRHSASMIRNIQLQHSEKSCASPM